MLEYSVGSSIDRDDLYAELSFNRIQFAEISLSETKQSINIIFYPDPENIFTFDYDDFLCLLEKAKERLLELEPMVKD